MSIPSFPASQLPIEGTGYTLPWHCTLTPDGLIFTKLDAPVTESGGGTRCIRVIRLDTEKVLGQFDETVTAMSFRHARNSMQRQ